jgi:hypothetical protein
MTKECKGKDPLRSGSVNPKGIVEICAAERMFWRGVLGHVVCSCMQFNEIESILLIQTLVYKPIQGDEILRMSEYS